MFTIKKLVFIVLVYSFPIIAIGVDQDEDKQKDLSENNQLPNVFSGFNGERIDLRTRQLTYEHVDLTMPGNGGLDIVVSRSHNKNAQSDYGQPNSIANWHLDVPMIWGNHFSGCDNPYPPGIRKTATYWVLDDFGWRVQISPNPIWNNFKSRDYYGLTLSIPGQSNRELLFKYIGNQLQDGKNGNSIEYVTIDNWKATCYQPEGASTAHAFLVTSPSGIKYFLENKTVNGDINSNTATWWEDAITASDCRLVCISNVIDDTLWVPEHFNQWGNPDEWTWLSRGALFNGVYGRIYDNFWDPIFFKVTKIEDVHGNTLNYTYSGGNGQLHLNKIQSNDGREVNFEYTYYPNFWMSQHVHLLKAVNTNDGRTINYTYMWDSAPYSPPLLRAVWLPENYFWQFDYESGDDFIQNFTKGIRIAEVQSPTFAKAIYRYQKVSSDFYGGISNKRPIFDSVIERDVWNTEWDTTIGATKEWKVGTWTFNSTQLTTSEPINRTTVTYPVTQDPVSKVNQQQISNTYDFSRDRNSWKYGLLLRTTVEDPNVSPSTVQQITYDWQKRLKLGENNAKDRPVSTIYQRALTRRTINQDGVIYSTQYDLFDVYNNPRKIIEQGNIVKGVQSNREQLVTYFNSSQLNIIGKLKDERITGTSGGGTMFNPTNEVCLGGECLTISGPEFMSGDGVIHRVISSDDGTLIWEKHFNVITSRFTYHTNGEVHTVKDANVNETTYENYYRGLPQSIITPENSISRSISDRGLIEWERDGRQNTTSFIYDQLNRIKKIARPVNNVEDISYPLYSDESSRGGRVVSQFYDGLNQNTLLRSFDPTTINFNASFYDAHGRTFLQTFSESRWDSSVWDNGVYTYYDALGRVVKIRKIDNDLDKDANTTVTYQYQSDGVLVTDEKGNQTKLFYMSFGNPDEKYLVGILLPPDDQGVRAEYVIDRNKNNQVTKIEELVSGFKREYEYNIQRLLWKVKDPETGTTEFQYDPAGNIISKTVAFGTSSATTTSYAYDGLNRQTRVDYPGLTPDIEIKYDGVGNIDSIGNGIAYWDYLYDKNNNITNEVLQIDNKRFHIAYGYSGNDHLSTMRYPSGQIIDYAPNALGEPTKALPFSPILDYHATGNLSFVEYANGRAMWQGLTPQKRIDKIAHARISEFLDIDLSYEYDLTGNISTITDFNDNSNNRVLVYDKLNRLTSATGRWGAGTISYDTVGNITNKNIGSVNLNYSVNPTTNKLESVSGSQQYTLGYDIYGNVTSTKPQNNFLYDDASNLVAASVSDTTLYNYAYDGNNRLVRTVKDSKTLYTAYNKAGRKLMEYSPDDDWVKEFYYVGSMIIADRKLTELSSTDTDGDGIINKVELENGLNLASAADKNADPDGDGLGAFDEIKHGTNIYLSDTDGDGIDDGDEINLYRTNPLKSDTDGDGVSDGDEIAAGTDPNVNIPVLMTIINNLLLNN